MTVPEYRAPEGVSRVQQGALIAGVIGVVLCAIGAFKWPESFFRSYLLAFMFILGLSLGSLGLLMLQDLLHQRSVRKRRLSGKQIIKRTAKTVDVATDINAVGVACLFGR